MSQQKEPWHVTLASYVSYLIVLAAGMWIGFELGEGAGRDRAHLEFERRQDSERQIAAQLAAARAAAVTFADNELVSVGSSGSSLKVLKLELPMTLNVSVEELQGKNIEFSALQDGHSVYSSGVHRGKATGEFRALPGLCTISLVNGNMLDGKQVALTVKGTAIQ